MSFLVRVLYAIGVGIVAWLLCILLSLVLISVQIAWVTQVGNFFGAYAALISLVAAIFAFVRPVPTWLA